MPLPIIGAALGLVKGAVKGVKKINQNRKANGKGGLLSGIFKGKKKKAAEKAQAEKEAAETEPTTLKEAIQPQAQAADAPQIIPAGVPNNQLSAAIYTPPVPSTPFDMAGAIETAKPVMIGLGAIALIGIIFSFLGRLLGGKN